MVYILYTLSLSWKFLSEEIREIHHFSQCVWAFRQVWRIANWIYLILGEGYKDPDGCMQMIHNRAFGKMLMGYLASAGVNPANVQTFMKILWNKSCWKMLDDSGWLSGAELEYNELWWR